MKRNILIN